MNKCINCAYFLNCENANEENACDNYKFIRKNIEKEETKSQIERLIEIKNIEREIADLFYKMCPKVPPQTLAIAVRQTIENFKDLNNLYNPKTKTEIVKRDYKDNIVDSLKYAIEGMKKINKDTIIGKPDTVTDIKLMQEYENHIPRIE